MAGQSTTYHFSGCCSGWAAEDQQAAAILKTEAAAILKTEAHLSKT
jgi:hypothetical protein